MEFSRKFLINERINDVACSDISESVDLKIALEDVGFNSIWKKKRILISISRANVA